MAYIREIPSSFHLWESEPLNDIVEEPILDPINPQSGFEARTSGTLKFLLNGNDTFIDLRRSYIELKFKLIGSKTIKEGEKDVQVDTTLTMINKSKLSVVNNIAHSLWKWIRIRLGNQTVTLGESGYGHLAYIQLLCNSTQEAQDTYFQVTGWKKDVAGKMDSSVDSTSPSTENNTSLYSRREAFFDHTTGIGHFRMKPHCGLMFMNKKIIPFLDIEVELARHDNPDFFCKSAFDRTYNIEILHAKYHVQRYKCSAAYVAGVERMLKVHALPYKYPDFHINTCTIPANTSNYSNDNLFHGNVPGKIIFAFVKTANFNGQRTSNPFNFDHFNIQSFRLLKNGVDYPYPELITDFNAVPPAFLDAYHQLMMNMNADYNEHVVSITPKEFGNGYLLFSFNMNADQDADYNLFNPMHRPSQIRADIRFASNLTNSVQMIVYYESPTLVTVDFARRVVVTHL